MNSLETPKPCGEILESTLDTIRCHIWDHATMPAYGSLVIIDMTQYQLYGIVTASGRGPRDATRTPHPYKKTPAELMRDHPHIFEFIVSWCSILCIGYEEHGTLLHIPPPVPPAIHTFVRQANSAEYLRIIESPHFVHRLFNAEQKVAPEELLIAFLKQSTSEIACYRAIIAELSFIIGSDYRRFKIIVNRLTATIHRP